MSCRRNAQGRRTARGAVAVLGVIVVLVAVRACADPIPRRPAGPMPPAPADTVSVQRPDRIERPPAEENEFPVILGSFSTTLIGSLPARTANVRLAAAALDGAVLRPGDVLSFNREVGARTRERGYRPAPVILHESRQLQTGGGVCQVASTIFAAALLSGLSMAERHHHSSPVDYIPPGQDATIAWGVKDLQVRNDLSQRVRLRVEVVGSTLTARIEGEEPPGEAYEIETEERGIPGDPGAGSAPGREIEVFLVRRTAGGADSRDFLFRDVYPPARIAGAR